MTAPERPLSQRLQSAVGLKPSRSAPAFGGWVRYDSDAVIRGWATNRNDRDAKLTVQVTIDDTPVATVTADRFDPKVRDAGEGEGTYAFAVLVPPVFADGRPHTFEAVIKNGPGYRLKSKQETFQTEAETSVPVLEVIEADWTGARVRLTTGQLTAPPRLEFWSRGVRLPREPEQTWAGRKGRFTYQLDVAPEWLAQFDEAPIDIAFPGLIEAGLAGVTLPLPTALAVERYSDGRLSVALGGATQLYSQDVELRVRAAGREEVVHAEPLAFQSGQAKAQLPPTVTDASIRVSLAIGGFEPARLRAAPRRAIGRVSRNSAFTRWDESGPAEWALGEPGLGLHRGFHRFPPKIAAQHAIAGDFVSLAVSDAVAGRRRILLTQALRTPLAKDDAGQAALLARASDGAALALRLLDDAGHELASVPLDAARPWSWVYAARTLVVLTSARAPTLELSVTPAADAALLTVDVAGVRFGETGFIDRAERAPEVVPAAADELVSNAALEQWPNGLAFSGGGSRLETAKDWFVLNRQTEARVFARAVLDERDLEGAGFAFAAGDVPHDCRLEVQLDDAAMARFSKGVLRFTASASASARRLLSQTAGPTSEFAVIERVMLVRRTTVATRSGFRISDANLVTAARRLLVTRAAQAFEIPVELEANPVTDLAPGGAVGDSEHFLVFQFRQPFAIALRDVSLKAGAAIEAAPPAYRQLEDRAIAAQAPLIRGLAAWVRPELATPTAIAEVEPTRRWRWAAAASGAVEVVVCVHNAPDETLACLQALTTTTATPHTVHVIDDASDPATAERLAAFVADRPWMRLTRHESNAGYTRSADEGVRAADSDWVVLLNSDTVVTPGWLEGLLQAAAGDPAVAFVGPVSNAATFQSVPELYGPDGKFAVNALPPGWTPVQVAAVVARESKRAFPETQLLNGFCTLMRRSAVLELGGFNIAAFPAGYGEENDLCTRAAKAGYKLVIADHVYVYHAKSASFGDERRTELAKAGSRALKALHPDVDFGERTARFRDLPPLVSLRAAVRRAYEQA